MAIEIIIRQKGFFHKVPLELEDLTDGHLEYGVMDFGYRLVPRETEGVVVFYDPDHIGRGMETTYEENIKDRIVLRLPDFSTKYDTAMLYEMTKRICRKWDTEEFEQNGRRVTVFDIPELKDQAEEFCMDYFRQIRNFVREDRMVITAALWPLRIPTDLLEKFGTENDAEGYAQYLHACQSRDLYYALPVIYQSRRTGELFGVYAISSGTDTIISLEPEVPASVGLPKERISFFAVSLVSIQEKKALSTIRFEDFIAEIKGDPMEAYDDCHVILPGLSEEKMAEIASKYPGAEMPAE